jgi:hypothetical protein
MNNGWIITDMSGYHGEELLPLHIINTFDRDKILGRIYCCNLVLRHARPSYSNPALSLNATKRSLSAVDQLQVL